MEKIVIYGAGGFGREVRMLIDQINLKETRYSFLGYFDDAIPKNHKIESYKILGGIMELNNFGDDIAVVLAIGSPQIKKQIANKIDNKRIYFPSLIHPSCIIDSESFTLGKGCIICAGNIITVNVNIGDFVILNLGCTIGHDTIIGSYSSFMPAVNISGEVKIEENVYCGTGVKIINQINIGKNSILGAGAVISKDIPSNCTAIGIPAKPIKYH